MFPLLQNGLIQQKYNLSPQVHHRLQQFSAFDAQEGIDVLSLEDAFGSIDLVSSDNKTEEDNLFKVFASKKLSKSSHKLSP